MDFIADSREMSVIEGILVLVGLNVGKKLNRSNFISRLIYVYQKFTVLWWLAFILHVIATLIPSHDINFSIVEDRLFRNSLEVNLFAAWCVIIKRRKKITILMQGMQYLAQTLYVKTNSSWTTFATIFIITLFFAGSLTVTLLFPQQYCQRMLRSYSVGLIGASEVPSCKNGYIMGPIFTVPKYIFCTLVCILYVYICRFFKKFLISHSESVLEKEQLSCKEFRDYLLRHERIVKRVKDFENVMSLPIFFLVMNDCLEMIFGFVDLYPFDEFSVTAWKQNLIWFNLFTSLRALISFLCVSLAAASVASASDRAKNGQQEILKLVHASTVQEKIELLLFIKVHDCPPLVLSAGGCIYFTNSLIFTAFCSVLTYSLLM
ncbi:hypothetical protein AVEN_178883-1 [Araneus ventricosus]|uniref:Gustatory receptor n=1 Tax=Araneus ventricosus TaxID=182803 RepID=A0A4Y1ZK32_ARAVE|nr:hypothetical protein AVEN_178883-1 [Araneus ventricosus]